MSLNIKTSFIQGLAAICLLLLLASTASADPVNYQYDDLNRLQQVEYADGTSILYGYDEVGNRIGHIQFNKNAAGLPTGLMTINAGAAYTASAAVELSLLCAANGSCAEMRFSNNNSDWSSPEPYDTSKSWNLAGDNATQTVYAQFSDAGGTWSSAINQSINRPRPNCLRCR